MGAPERAVRLLISGYVRHNLPSRVDCGALESQGGSIYQAISGMGITGFSYANIARQEKLSASFEAPEGGNTKFEDLSLVLQSLKGGGEDRTFQGAELEYICAGTNSELANQVFTFMNLYFLRLILDLGSVLMDPNVAETAAAATLAAWAVYILYILVEPFCDMLLLVNGEKVPLVKTRCWLTKAKIGKFVTMLADAVSDVEELKNMVAGLGGDAKPDEKEDGGLLDRGYGTHVLLLLLLTVPAENQIRRLQDLAVMETEEYYRRAGKEFTMDKAYTAVEVSGGVRFQPFFDLGVASGGAPLLPELQITRMVSY